MASLAGHCDLCKLRIAGLGCARSWLSISYRQDRTHPCFRTGRHFNPTYAEIQRFESAKYANRRLDHLCVWRL